MVLVLNYGLNSVSVVMLVTLQRTYIYNFSIFIGVHLLKALNVPSVTKLLLYTTYEYVHAYSFHLAAQTNFKTIFFFSPQNSRVFETTFWQNFKNGICW